MVAGEQSDSRREAAYSNWCSKSEGEGRGGEGRGGKGREGEGRGGEGRVGKRKGMWVRGKMRDEYYGEYESEREWGRWGDTHSACVFGSQSSLTRTALIPALH